MPLYQKQTNEAGEEVYVEVDEAEVVKEHDLYKSVLGESIERRKELQALKDAKPKTPEGEKPKESPKTPEIDPEKLVQEAVSKVLETIKQERQQQSEREAQIAKLMKDYKLPETVRSAMIEAPNPETLAKALQAANIQVATETVNPQGSTPIDDIMTKVDKKLGWVD